MTTKEEIDNIFKKWEQLLTEEYIPEKTTNTSEEPPKYIPTPTNEGPKPITIEQYRARQQKYRSKTQENRSKLTQPKKRGGKKRKFQAACRDLQRIIDISQGKQKKNLIEKLIALKKEGWK